MFTRQYLLHWHHLPFHQPLCVPGSSGDSACSHCSRKRQGPAVNLPPLSLSSLGRRLPHLPPPAAQPIPAWLQSVSSQSPPLCYHWWRLWPPTSQFHHLIPLLLFPLLMMLLFKSALPLLAPHVYSSFLLGHTPRGGAVAGLFSIAVSIRDVGTSSSP